MVRLKTPVRVTKTRTPSKSAAKAPASTRKTSTRAGKAQTTRRPDSVTPPMPDPLMAIRVQNGKDEEGVGGAEEENNHVDDDSEISTLEEIMEDPLCIDDDGEASTLEEDPPCGRDKEPIIEGLSLSGTLFSGPYQSRFLDLIPPAEHDALSHMNCSYFSHSNGKAPTLHDLKSHARSLTVLLKNLDIVDNPAESDAFDWLDSLDGSYKNDDATHHLPLNSVRNTVRSFEDAYGQLLTTLGCPRDQDAPPPFRLFQHANEMLELLDEVFVEYGGLQGCLPPEGTESRKKAEDTLLGQWLVHTRSLIWRLAQQELEVNRLRDILASEAIRPYQLAQNERCRDGKPLLYPQDQYVLGNLPAELWTVLDEKLKTAEREQLDIDKLTDLRVRPAQMEPVPAGEEPLRPVACIDVPSRLYRLEGSPTIFILPAYGIHPNTEATRKLESRAILTTFAIKPNRSARLPKQMREERAAMEAAQAESFKATELKKQTDEDNLMYRRELAKLGEQLTYEQAKVTSLRAEIEKHKVTLDQTNDLYLRAKATASDLEKAAREGRDGSSQEKEVARERPKRTQKGN